MRSQAQRFAGKVILITGASSGIGAAAAGRFTAEGGRVVLVARAEKALAEVAVKLGDDHCVTAAADVSVPEGVNRAVGAAIERWEGSMSWSPARGFNKPATIENVSPRDWDQAITVNLSSVFYCARAAMPHLIKSRGCIVNVASMSGLRADWGWRPTTPRRAAWPTSPGRSRSTPAATGCASTP